MQTEEFKRRSAGNFDCVSWEIMSGEKNEKLQSNKLKIDDAHETVEYGECTVTLMLQHIVVVIFVFILHKQHTYIHTYIHMYTNSDMYYLL